MKNQAKFPDPRALQRMALRCSSRVLHVPCGSKQDLQAAGETIDGAESPPAHLQVAERSMGRINSCQWRAGVDRGGAEGGASEWIRCCGDQGDEA